MGTIEDTKPDGMDIYYYLKEEQAKLPAGSWFNIHQKRKIDDTTTWVYGISVYGKAMYINYYDNMYINGKCDITYKKKKFNEILKILGYDYIKEYVDRYYKQIEEATI
jgi:hypothetical protein